MSDSEELSESKTNQLKQQQSDYHQQAEQLGEQYLELDDCPNIRPKDLLQKRKSDPGHVTNRIVVIQPSMDSSGFEKSIDNDEGNDDVVDDNDDDDDDADNDGNNENKDGNTGNLKDNGNKKLQKRPRDFGSDYNNSSVCSDLRKHNVGSSGSGNDLDTITPTSTDVSPRSERANSLHSRGIFSTRSLRYPAGSGSSSGSSTGLTNFSGCTTRKCVLTLDGYSYVIVASTPENKTRDDSSVFDRRSYDTSRSKSNSPTSSSNIQNPCPINGQVAKQGGLTIVRRSNSRKGNLSYQAVAQSPSSSGGIEQQELIGQQQQLQQQSIPFNISTTATTNINTGTSNQILNRTSDTNPFTDTSNIATTSFICNRTIEQQQPLLQQPHLQQHDNIFSDQYSTTAFQTSEITTVITKITTTTTTTSSALSEMIRSNNTATTPTGSGTSATSAGTIVPQSTSSACSATTTASYGDCDIETIDLTTDQLPAVDTPDACDKAAVRLRCLLRLLQRGEISAEVLQKNLHYAARVLEAVFIDETNPCPQRPNSNYSQDNTDQKSGQSIERKDSDQDNDTTTTTTQTTINKTNTDTTTTATTTTTTTNTNTLSKNINNIKLASNNPFITTTNSTNNSSSCSNLNICNISCNLNKIEQEQTTTLLGRTKGVSTAPQTHSGPTGPPLTTNLLLKKNTNNSNNSNININNNNKNNNNSNSNLTQELQQSLSSSIITSTSSTINTHLISTNKINQINLITNKNIDDSNCSSNTIISSDNVDSNINRSGGNLETGNNLNDNSTTSIIRTTPTTTTTATNDNKNISTLNNSSTTTTTTTTNINNSNNATETATATTTTMTIDGDNKIISGNQIQDNSGDNSNTTTTTPTTTTSNSNDNKNKTTLQRRRLRAPVWARSMSNKMRLADEDDELSEVQPDAVPPEVREWLASTFTRQLATTKRRSDEKPKFRSVAHAIRAGIFVDRIYRRVSSSALMQFPPEVVKVLKNLDDWSFDVFALAEAANGQPVKYLGYDLLNRYGIIHKFKISPTVLETFLTRIEEGYSKFHNPYHNNLHAADVTQTTHHILCQTGLMNWLTDLEIYATLLAALIHDYEHTGTTNNFHVMSGSETAMIYNDRAVLENHHISAAFRVIKEDDCNVLANLSREEYRELRTLVIDMVLSTDMSFHFQQLKNMKNLLTLDSPTVDKSKALALVLHCCDISHPAKKWTLHNRWTKLLLEEFFRQGDLERELGLPFSPLCDRNNTLVAESQIGFIDFIVDPSMSVCSDMLEYILAPIAPIRTTGQGIGATDNSNGDKNNDDNNSTPPTSSISGTTCESISENSELSKSCTSTELGSDGKPKFRIKKPWAITLGENKKIWKEQAVKDAEARAIAAAAAAAAANSEEMNSTETETKTE